MDKIALIHPDLPPIQPLPSPTYYPFATLTKPIHHPGIFLLELNFPPDNRLTQQFINQTILPALSDIEREFRASRINKLAPADGSSSGWKSPKSPGQYALVTCGPLDKNRIYSNGLNLEQAFADEGFFRSVLNKMYLKLFTFPIPTVAALNGHAFAGGFVLALSHDYRVMKDNEAKGKAMVAMNEIEFGASVPRGLLAVLDAKLPNKQEVTRCLLEAHRYGVQEALKLGIVDRIAPEADLIEQALQFASQKSIRAITGVYDLIKADLYKEAIEILTVSDEGYVHYASANSRKLHQLGTKHFGVPFKPKL
ncbi:ClpP/crotonase-like domain-containing protein [Melampsora americana]|nr:ClpP/crotonase-like domain-containing protein [Melampsora americana]